MYLNKYIDGDKIPSNQGKYRISSEESASVLPDLFEGGGCIRGVAECGVGRVFPGDDGFFAGEGVDAVAGMVAAHSAGADAAEGGIAVCYLYDAVVDADAA